MARQQTAPGAVGAVSVRKGSRGWRGRARVRDWSGEVRELSRFGATRVEATEKISAAVSEALLRGGHESITAATAFHELAELWVANLPTTALAASSQRVYRSEANAHILAKGSPMRALTLAQISPAKINAALRQVAEASGYGAAKTLLTVYHSVFELALSHEAISQNPAAAATMPSKAGVDTPPRPERDTKRAFTPAEEGALLAWVAASPWANDVQLVTLVDVLRGTGVRIAEAINLSWGDVDFETGLLEVHGTKTAPSDRVISMPDWLVSRLRDRKKSIPWARPDSPICPSPKGMRRDLSNTVRAMRKLLEEAGFPWARSHTFRKTVATKLDKAGLTAREIANHLGHSDIGSTMIYMDRRQGSPRAATAL